MLVDYALSRVERGLAGVLEVTGPDNPNVYKDHDPDKSAKSMSHWVSGCKFESAGLLTGGRRRISPE